MVDVKIKHMISGHIETNCQRYNLSWKGHWTFEVTYDVILLSDGRFLKPPAETNLFFSSSEVCTLQLFWSYQKIKPSNFGYSACVMLFGMKK